MPRHRHTRQEAEQLLEQALKTASGQGLTKMQVNRITHVSRPLIDMIYRNWLQCVPPKIICDEKGLSHRPNKLYYWGESRRKYEKWIELRDRLFNELKRQNIDLGTVQKEFAFLLFTTSDGKAQLINYPVQREDIGQAIVQIAKELHSQQLTSEVLAELKSKLEEKFKIRF